MLLGLAYDVHFLHSDNTFYSIWGGTAEMM